LTGMRKRNQFFSEAYQQVFAIAFDQQVVSVFPAMIKGSDRCHDTLFKGIAMFAKRFVHPNTPVSELVASLGVVSFTNDESIATRNIDLHAIDNSEAMIDQLVTCLKDQTITNRIQTHHADLRQIDINSASMVVSNFTLQFLPPGER